MTSIAVKKTSPSVSSKNETHINHPILNVKSELTPSTVMVIAFFIEILGGFKSSALITQKHRLIQRHMNVSFECHRGMVECRVVSPFHVCEELLANEYCIEIGTVFSECDLKRIFVNDYDIEEEQWVTNSLRGIWTRHGDAFIETHYPLASKEEGKIIYESVTENLIHPFLEAMKRVQIGDKQLPATCLYRLIDDALWGDYEGVDPFALACHAWKGALV